MISLVTTSVFRNGGLFVGVLCILLFGTWTVVEATTRHLLYQNATATAHSWAKYLASNVTDLEQIAAGERPSIASMAFFIQSTKSGQVFRYEIYDSHGYSLLVSNQHETTLVDVSEFSADAVHAMKTRQPVVGTRESEGPGQPAFYAQALIPVLINDRAVAVVAAYVDQSQQRDSFHRAFIIASAALCLLIGLSFAIPTIAWYRRTQEKQIADRRVRFLAHHDALTGLANRPRLIEQLEKALSARSLQGGSLAVYFIDLDRFKEVNDTLGHDAGDFLLKTVADRISAVTRIDDVAARLGGDEFVVVQTGVRGKDQAEDFARRLVSAMIAPITVKEQQISATASVGVAMAPTDGTTPERLLKSADLALYKSKADGRNCVHFFAPEMDEALHTRVVLEKTLRDAVLHERFILHYQPLFELSGRRLISFEALIRLPAEDGSLIPPAVFIPVAEDLRLIDGIGAWVLKEACRTAATWPAHITVAVNLSPAQFEAGTIITIVTRALKEAGLAPHRLELEITETLLLGNSAAILSELKALKAMGVAIVMDDFGTGFSSLSYLWRFPFDKIKLDRSFIQGFDTASRGAALVMKSMISLGRQLGMRVTVEGVETAKQVAFLDGADADQVQGFFFGRPVARAEIGAEILKDIQEKLLPTRPVSRTRKAVAKVASG